MPILVDGQVMDDHEIHDLMRMIRHDIQEIAGQFFDGKRSRKFRRHFKTEGEKRGMSAERWFVESESQHFEAALPQFYTETLRFDSDIYERATNSPGSKANAPRTRQVTQAIRHWSARTHTHNSTIMRWLHHQCANNGHYCTAVTPLRRQ